MKLKNSSTYNCKGWFAIVNGKLAGDECYNGCGNYYCENCVDEHMIGYEKYHKICKKCLVQR